MTANRKGAVKNEILFTVFEKIVLDYQLNEHCKFLDKFNELFDQIDTDTNGIISRQQFVDLLFQMDIIDYSNLNDTEGGSSEEALHLLNSIDPYETDQIILSEIIKLLTVHTAKIRSSDSESGMEQVSVLEKFVTKALEQEDLQK